MATLLVYLNDVPQSGGPSLNLVCVECCALDVFLHMVIMRSGIMWGMAGGATAFKHLNVKVTPQKVGASVAAC